MASFKNSAPTETEIFPVSLVFSFWPLRGREPTSYASDAQLVRLNGVGKMASFKNSAPTETVIFPVSLVFSFWPLRGLELTS